MMYNLLLIIFCTVLSAQIDTLVTIDASSYNDWVYFSFDAASVIEIDNPENSLDWDVAFQRKHIRTNGGLGGLGEGAAAVDSTLTWIDEWDTIHSIPENTFFVADTILNDFYDFSLRRERMFA